MPGTAARAFAPGRHGLTGLALAAAGALSLASLSWPPLAPILALAALLAALPRSGWRGPLLLVALVAGHASWQAAADAGQRLRAPLLVESARIEVLRAAPPRAGRQVLLARQPGEARRLRLSVYGAAPAAAGDCLRGRLRLRPPQGSRNFDGFDYGRWLAGQGIGASGSLSRVQRCPGQVAGPAIPGGAVLPDTPGAALLRALLYADRSGFDAAIWDTLARSGSSHLFAISGLHVGLLAGLAGLLGGGLWRALPPLQSCCRRRSLALLAAALAVLGLLLLAWGQVSARRAGLTALAVIAVLAGGRRLRPLSLWALALLVVIGLQPRALLGPALWLSFGACLLLLALLPRVSGRPRWQQLLAVQALLGLGLAPLVLHFFGQWSLLGLGLNLLLVPALALFLPLALAAGLLAELGLHAPLRALAFLLNQGYAGLEALAGWPAAAWSLPAPSLPLAVALVALPALALGAAGSRNAAASPPRAQARAARGERRWSARSWPVWRRHGPALLLSLWLLGLAGLPLRAPAAPPAGTARLWALDVGQGQSLLLQTRQHWVVIDAGPRSRGGFDAGAMIVAPQLRALGARRIDLLVSSHADLDHAGGRAALRARLPVAAHWGAGGQDCEQGLRWQADGVRLRSLALGAQPHWSENDRSCVLLLEVAGRRLLLPGDIEARAEAALLPQLRALGGVDALLVPHHGSATSSTAALVAATRPRLAIVSAGAHNRWGFPRPEVRARWAQAGAAVLVTGEGGAVRLELPALAWTRPPQRPWMMDPL